MSWGTERAYRYACHPWHPTQTMSGFWHALTQLGDSRWLLPMATTFALCLPRTMASLRWRWIVAIAAIASITLLSKVAFMGWGVGIPAWDFTGISAHAAMSGVIYPLVAVLLIAPHAQLRRPALFIGIALAVAIAYSRLPLRAHSPSEIITGCLLGMSAALWTLRGNAGLQRPPAPGILLSAALGAVVPIALPHVHTHDVVIAAAKQISGHTEIHARP
ncbi:MAG: hypothetical protein GAK31_00631 [Stenotrophomonas maltophilia]|uniref:Phosphatidic acid phosphatase type 2/haloperoxidase domain-containing protein n=1 Tax=Stenotrophomonas maltophilia TaxID=40324 RepID=A0A7V8JNG6_STEMA|nr:MAG: hypothetical protein GAK31_00631 [Stenotrophomonas maltophilia]